MSSTPLANKIVKSTDTAGSRQYLMFIVSGTEMAVSLDRVSEIVPYERVATVPGTPDYIRGVVHVRGRVVPVVDLAIKLGRAPEASSKRTCILMLELEVDGAQLPMGVVVDGVATLLEVERREVSAPPRFGAGVEVAYLEGMYPTARGMLPLVDVTKLFAVDELARVASRAPATGGPL